MEFIVKFYTDQNRVKRVLVLGMLLIIAIYGCETALDMHVGISWLDDDHFSSGSARYLGVVEGEFDLDSGFETTLIELAKIIPGDDTVHTFALPSNSSTNYTAFVFIDMNNNANYDEGYDVISGYKYNCVQPGECLNISVSAFY